MPTATRDKSIPRLASQASPLGLCLLAAGMMVGISCSHAMAGTELATDAPATQATTQPATAPSNPSDPGAQVGADAEAIQQTVEAMAQKQRMQNIPYHDVLGDNSRSWRNSPAAREMAAGHATFQPAGDAPTTGPSASQPASSQPDDDKPATIAQQRQEIISHLTKNYSMLPARQPAALADLIQIKQENGHLLMTTTLPADGKQYRVPILDTPGSAIYSHRALPAGGIGQIHVIQLEWYDFTNPELVTTHFMISSLNGQNQINMDVQGAESLLSIQLIDRVATRLSIPQGDMPSTALYVNRTSDGQAGQIRIRIGADNLQTLYYQQTRIINTYVRPMLRTLGKESFLDISPAVAWQVIGDKRDVDPAMRRRVMDLLTQLGAEGYRDRDAAQKQLQDIGAPAVRVLGGVNRQSLSPEQISRLEQVISHQHELSTPEMGLLTGNTDFLVDCLLIPDKDLQQAVLVRLNEGRKTPIQMDFPTDLAKLSQAVDDLRRQILPEPPAELDTLVGQLPPEE